MLFKNDGTLQDFQASNTISPVIRLIPLGNFGGLQTFAMMIKPTRVLVIAILLLDQRTRVASLSMALLRWQSYPASEARPCCFLALAKQPYGLLR